ncbi:MAG: FkbM family methyltransferase [Methanomicrobia archaeon]|nr:FkbM family methyltransferase [Methanomicrobia archaeon]
MDTVVDIGAQIGIFSCLAAKYADKVIAIEPHPVNFSLLRENMRLNNQRNIVPSQMAVSGKNGVQTLFLSEQGTADHSLIPFDTESLIEVTTCTLERLIESYELESISLLKMDCEGCEYEVLNSSRKLLNRIDRLVLESHHGYTEELIRLLRDEGFVVSVEDNYIYAYSCSGNNNIP